MVGWCHQRDHCGRSLGCCHLWRSWGWGWLGHRRHRYGHSRGWSKVAAAHGRLGAFSARSLDGQVFASASSRCSGLLLALLALIAFSTLATLWALTTLAVTTIAVAGAALAALFASHSRCGGRFSALIECHLRPSGCWRQRLAQVGISGFSDARIALTAFTTGGTLAAFAAWLLTAFTTVGAFAAFAIAGWAFVARLVAIGLVGLHRQVVCQIGV